MKAEAYNLYGQKLKFREYDLRADINFEPNCQAQIPEDYFIFNSTSSFSGTEAIFEWKFIRAPTGHFYLELNAYHKINSQDLDSDQERYDLK